MTSGGVDEDDVCGTPTASAESEQKGVQIANSSYLLTPDPRAGHLCVASISSS